MEYWVVFSTTGVEGRRKETRVESGDCGENKTWTGEMREGIYTRCIEDRDQKMWTHRREVQLVRTKPCSVA